MAATGADQNYRNKELILKNCAPFTDCIKQTKIAQLNNAKDIDVVMPMYNLIECSDNYSKTYLEIYGSTKEMNQY